jgi:EAL domain-containing protein (putative c-di-GMP-specific phosphodiesterase class I)
VAHALRRGGFDPGRLAIEVTETHLMSDLGTHRGVLQSVRDLGVGIALDDFGTGYSSLAYFATLPATGIKVDKSFVAGIVDDEHARAIVNAVSTLARSFGRSVVVEGIETPEQWQQAIALGADRFQGYLFGRPGRIGTSSPELLLTASNRP